MYSCKVPSWLAGTASRSGRRWCCLFFSRPWALSLVVVRCQVAPVRQAGRNCSCPETAAPSQKALSIAPGLRAPASPLPGLSVCLLSSHLGSLFLTLLPLTVSHLELELAFFFFSFYSSKISGNSLVLFVCFVLFCF